MLQWLRDATQLYRVDSVTRGLTKAWRPTLNGDGVTVYCEGRPYIHWKTNILCIAEEFRPLNPITVAWKMWDILVEACAYPRMADLFYWLRDHGIFERQSDGARRNMWRTLTAGLTPDPRIWAARRRAIADRKADPLRYYNVDRERARNAGYEYRA